MKRWFAMSTQFTLDEKIEALGEEHGPGGPLAVCVMLGQAKIQANGGEVEGTFRDLAHATFTEREKAKEIVETAADLAIVEKETITDRGYEVRFPRWRQWQEAFRKQVDREESAGVRNGPQASATSPPNKDIDNDKDTDKKKNTNNVSANGVADAPLCKLLADLIAENGSRRPRIGQRWKDAERLLLERDKRDRSEAERLLRWCQSDEFWRANILSMPKFREKYDQLRLQAQRDGGVVVGKPPVRPLPGEESA